MDDWIFSLRGEKLMKCVKVIRKWVMNEFLMIEVSGRGCVLCWWCWCGLLWMNRGCWFEYVYDCSGWNVDEY